jgi:hypothetical protein
MRLEFRLGAPVTLELPHVLEEAGFFSDPKTHRFRKGLLNEKYQIAVYYLGFAYCALFWLPPDADHRRKDRIL